MSKMTSLRDEVLKYTIEEDLQQFNTLAIKRLKDIQCSRIRAGFSSKNANPRELRGKLWPC
ncbi:small ribosomal subunit protein uS13c-like [Physcomitrium patens]|uniref:small ribosomal subunit protein uS13c-like n=1 Tax=Physcomitrium patens TaxID=3218 RepID=UPI003CCCB03D